MLKFVDLKGGLSVDETLEACRNGCEEGPLRPIVTSGYFEVFANNLRAATAGPITDAQAVALTAIVKRTSRMSLPAFVMWIKTASDSSPEDYVAAMDAEAEAAGRASERANYDEWQPVTPGWRFEQKAQAAIAAAKAESAARLRRCRDCHSPADQMNWRYAVWEGPAGSQPQGWKGWLVTCEQCKFGLSMIDDLDDLEDIGD